MNDVIGGGVGEIKKDTHFAKIGILSFLNCSETTSLITLSQCKHGLSL